MKCPICGSELRAGYFPLQQLEWVPMAEKPHLEYRKDKSNGFRIGFFRNRRKFPAQWCESCEKLFLDSVIENPDPV